MGSLLRLRRLWPFVRPYVAPYVGGLAVLSAAASFLGAMSQTHQDVRSEHVLMLAERWLAWVEGS